MGHVQSFLYVYQVKAVKPSSFRDPTIDCWSTPARWVALKSHRSSGSLRLTKNVCQENHRSKGEHFRLAMFVDTRGNSLHENLSLQYLRFSRCTCPFSGVQCTSEDVIGVYIILHLEIHAWVKDIQRWPKEIQMWKANVSIETGLVLKTLGAESPFQVWKCFMDFFLAPSRHPKMVIFTWDMAWLSHHFEDFLIMTLPPRRWEKNDPYLSATPQKRS